MNPKRLIQVFNNHELGLQERLFRLLVTIGLMGLAMGILVGLVLGESMANTLSLLVVFALAVAITYFSIHFHKIQIGAVLISVLLIYFALPFNFLTSGGIYGGGPIWLMFGVVFVCLVVEKKAKYILIASSFCLYGACYLTAYWNPRIMEFHTIQAAYVDSFFTLAAVTVLVCSMILFQNAMYRKENKIAKEQKKEIEELKNQLLRLQADFVNYKNRTEREKSNSIILANEDLILKLLPILDNFNRAFAHADLNDKIIKGFVMIKEQFESVLKSEMVEEIESDGAVFDPNLHNAVMTESKEGVKSGIVLETFAKGYKIKDKVIRPSMVKVSE